MVEPEKIACRTPTEGRKGVTNIPAWKFDALRQAILTVVEAAGPDGALFSTLPAEAAKHLSADERARLGSLGWHVTTVKLELEVRGEIARLSGSPQRLVRQG
jgi:hypothetical protein